MSEQYSTRGEYTIVAGPIDRPMDCKEFVVLNDDGSHEQLHLVKVFPNGRVSKRGESQYDLLEWGVDDGEEYFSCGC